MDKQKPPLLTVSMTWGDDSVSISRPFYTDDDRDGSVEVGQVIGHAIAALTNNWGFSIGPALIGVATAFEDSEDAQIVKKAMAVLWAGTNASWLKNDHADVRIGLKRMVAAFNEGLCGNLVPFKLAIVESEEP
jgi:hypothetical protein